MFSAPLRRVRTTGRRPRSVALLAGIWGTLGSGCTRINPLFTGDDGAASTSTSNGLLGDDTATVPDSSDDRGSTIGGAGTGDASEGPNPLTAGTASGAVPQDGTSDGSNDSTSEGGDGEDGDDEGDDGEVGDDELKEECYELRAVKLYEPSRWLDAELRLPRRLELVIPDTLEVLVGNAGNHTSQLVLYTDNGEIECTYRGGSDQAHPVGDVQIDLGTEYLFERCTNENGATVAGPDQSVSADFATLTVNGSLNFPEDPSEPPETEAVAVLCEL